MEPTLSHGDLVLVWWGGRARQGSLVVHRDPRGAGLLMVKRAAFRDSNEPTRWWVERDNPLHGADSWSFGPIHSGDIVARVILRLPRPRTRE